MQNEICTISERWPNAVDICKQPILLASNPPYLLKTIRLLAGDLCVSEDDEGEVHYLNQNFINPNYDAKAENVNSFLSDLFDEIPSDEELRDILQNLSRRNRDFFQEVFLDSQCIVRSFSNENHTECFLFIYRMLERISTACPLLYLSTETDFKYSHAFLSSVYNENKAPGSLSMLKKFLNYYAGRHENFSEANLDFDFSVLSSSYSSRIFSELRKITEGEVADIEFDEQREKVTIPFKDVSSFIVTVRNRTFHNEGARKNVNLSAIGGSEPLFRFLVPQLLMWLAYVFFDIAKWQIADSKR